MLGIVSKKTLIILGVLVGVVVIFAIGSDQRSSGAEQGGGGQPSAGCTVTVTADVLNVRSAPGTGSAIVGKYNAGARVEASGEVQDGFRELGDGRWASDDFLEPVEGARC
ncbi:SH3 domain-containing protein [Prauserella marina]|uniref:SH3 domain-containing protein n=1 Tax=Prauserella marina TaxID=530584 RepID=A0A1G6ZHM7_9PSEU|nr:SH3 domain-containing protein [Prauserella marina]SDE01991.1 SH3 domain-containing protein [Prauserella marina]